MLWQNLVWSLTSHTIFSSSLVINWSKFIFKGTVMFKPFLRKLANELFRFSNCRNVLTNVRIAHLASVRRLISRSTSAPCTDTRSPTSARGFYLFFYTILNVVNIFGSLNSLLRIVKAAIWIWTRLMTQKGSDYTLWNP